MRVMTRKRYAASMGVWILAVAVGALLCSGLAMVGAAIAGERGHMYGTIGSYAVVVLAAIVAKSILMTRRMRDAGISPMSLILYWALILFSIRFSVSSSGVGFNFNIVTVLALILFEPVLLLKPTRGVEAPSAA